MAEASLYTFNFKELAEILVKDQNIHEGLWSIYVKFGINAANVGTGPSDLLPTALVPVLEIGIQKQDKTNSLTVDAAEVNPPSRKKKTG